VSWEATTHGTRLGGSGFRVRVRVRALTFGLSRNGYVLVGVFVCVFVCWVVVLVLVLVVCYLDVLAAESDWGV
jgi:IS4 transposase